MHKNAPFVFCTLGIYRGFTIQGSMQFCRKMKLYLPRENYIFLKIVYFQSISGHNVHSAYLVHSITPLLKTNNTNLCIRTIFLSYNKNKYKSLQFPPYSKILRTLIKMKYIMFLVLTVKAEHGVKLLCLSLNFKCHQIYLYSLSIQNGKLSI